MGRKKPYLSNVADADNRTADKPYNGTVGVRVVENPFVETQPHVQRVTVTTSLRDVPLERLNARKQIRPHQYEAGSRLQRLFELAEPGNVRAIEYKSPVQSGGK